MIRHDTIEKDESRVYCPVWGAGVEPVPTLSRSQNVTTVVVCLHNLSILNSCVIELFQKSKLPHVFGCTVCLWENVLLALTRGSLVP